MLKKSSPYFFFFLIFAMASCTSSCPYREIVTIPSRWYTALDRATSGDDPACFHWWEALEDPLLTQLIEQAAYKNSDVQLVATAQSKAKTLETMNGVAAEIAKNYIKLRALQAKKDVLQGRIEAQNVSFTLDEGLSASGFIGSIDQSENKKTIEVFNIEKSQIELEIDKTIYHLSTLLSHAPGGLYEMLSPLRKLPKLPCYMPVGSPMEVIQRHPGIQQAREEYEKTHTKIAYYNYQKKILDVLEQIESALTALHFEQEAAHSLENIKYLKAEDDQMIRDLNQKGLKDDRAVQAMAQELFLDEEALIKGKMQLLLSYVDLYQALSGGWIVD